MSSRTWQRTTAVIAELNGERERYEGSARQDLGRFWRTELAPRGWRLAGAILLTAVWSSLPFIFTFTWRYLVDNVLLLSSGRDLASLSPEEFAEQTRRALRFFLMNMSLWTVWLVTHWTRSYLMLHVGRDVVYSLRRRLHEKLQDLHVGYYERTPTGRIVSRVLDDVNVIDGWVTTHGVNILASLTKLVIGLGVIIYLDWRLTITVLVSIPIYAWCYLALRPRVRWAQFAMRRLVARMYGRASERVRGVMVIQSFARERAETLAFGRMTHDSVRVAMRMVGYNQALMVVAGVVTALTTGVILLYGSSEVRSGALTVGSLIAFLHAMNHLFEPVNQLTHLAIEVEQVLVVLRRVFGLLDEPIGVVPGRIKLEGMAPKVTLQDVTFTYPMGKRPALEKVTFRIQPGERVAIMGPSGSGKTTLFQLLLRFYDPQEGAVRVGGVNLKDADPRSVRNHVRMVQQEPVLFSGTIAENIMYGDLDARPEQVMKSARQAELHEFIMTLPDKYETEVGEKGVTLSGGQKQRLALATALLTEPEVLLLDDTTSALDAETEAKIRATLNRVLAGRTSCIITQRVTTARDCDRILVFEEGRLTQQGTHDQLAAQEGFYRGVCRKQGVAAEMQSTATSGGVAPSP